MCPKSTSLLIFSLLWAFSLAADPKYFLSLKGQKSGIIYHQNITTLSNVAPILGFNFSAVEPHDAATGQATGKLQTTPVTFSKEMDIASPLLLQILTTNEIFQATIFAVESSQATDFALKLTNGALSGVSYGAGATQLVETIAMVFQKFEIDATSGGKTVAAAFDTQAPIV